MLFKKKFNIIQNANFIAIKPTAVEDVHAFKPEDGILYSTMTRQDWPKLYWQCMDLWYSIKAQNMVFPIRGGN